MKKDNFTYTTNPNNGTIESRGFLEVTKGDHTGMPKRTDAYPEFYERGHTNASSLGGANHTLNVHPQARDLNHGAFASMEQGQRDALKSGAVFSEKIAYNSGPAGTAPDAYMINDTVIHADGSSHTVHLSFANLNNAEQETFQQTLDQNADMLDAPNPGDIGRELYTPDEYAQLMEECEANMGTVRDEYSDDWSCTSYDEVDLNADED